MSKIVTFKADMNAIIINEYPYSNQSSISQENIDMDACVKSYTDIDQDVAMNDVAAETALKNCTTKYNKTSGLSYYIENGLKWITFQPKF